MSTWKQVQPSKKPKFHFHMALSFIITQHMAIPLKLSSTTFSSALLLTPSFSPPYSSLIFNNSMLKRLPLSSTWHRFLSHQTRLISLPRQYPSSFTYCPSLSWPFSVICPRSIHALKVLAMAEQTPKPSSHSHKHTNRLAAEHSPYLLQHAHNPVSHVIYLRVLQSLFCFAPINCGQRKDKFFFIFFM